MPVAAEHAGGGPVYFALVEPTETTFGPEHIRYDEYIRRFELVLEEGKLPLLTLDIKNPGALLAEGRERWAWFAFDDDDGVRQAFFGAIAAIPSDLFGNMITVQLIARPLDYLARKVAAAETLKADPDFYDPIFVDPKFADDPDTALIARSAAWHHDPVTHAVTISDFLVGEDGAASFYAADVIRGSLKFSIGEAPKNVAAMDASVIWSQTATGTIELPTKVVRSYTGQSLLEGWPQPLDDLGGGWSVEASSIVDRAKVNSAYVLPSGYKYENKSKEHINGDTLTHTENRSTPIVFGTSTRINMTFSESVTVGDPETGRAAASSGNQSWTELLQNNILADMTLRYRASRDRTEHLRFTLTAEMQGVLTDFGGTDDIETLTLKGGDVGLVWPGDSEPAIGDPSRRSFFYTDRGQQAMVYAINVLRAHLLEDSRVASASFDCRFRRALALTCRMNVVLHNADLPGGLMTGKIMKISLTGDGDSGIFKGNITIGAAAGTGEALEGVDGDPTVAAADVFGPDLQIFDGRLVVAGTGDILFPPLVDGPDDDGLTFTPLTYAQAVVRDEILTSAKSQATALSLVSALGGSSPASSQDIADRAQEGAVAVNDIFADAMIWIELELKPVDNGPFEAEYIFDVVMSVPKQIDLAGAA